MLLAFEFIPANHFRQIDLKQAGLLAFQLRQRSAQGALAILQGLREPFTGLGAGQFMGYKLRIGQNAAKILPDQQVQRIGRRIACRSSVRPWPRAEHPCARNRYSRNSQRWPGVRYRPIDTGHN